MMECIASSARLTPRAKADVADKASRPVIIRTQLQRSLVVSPGRGRKVHDRDSRVAKWIAARRLPGLTRSTPQPSGPRLKEHAHGYVHCRQDRTTRPDRPFRPQDQ